MQVRPSIWMCEDSVDNKQGGVLALQPEQQVRGKIDVLLKAAGWHVCDMSAGNIYTAQNLGMYVISRNIFQELLIAE
ncbi:MAG: hypothetical protein Q8K12_16425 [Thiobacillus sp.]|nr:hypothetical protein [Thiobacillus sp.]